MKKIRKKKKNIYMGKQIKPLKETTFQRNAIKHLTKT